SPSRALTSGRVIPTSTRSKFSCVSPGVIERGHATNAPAATSSTANPTTTHSRFRLRTASPREPRPPLALGPPEEAVERALLLPGRRTESRHHPPAGIVDVDADRRVVRVPCQVRGVANLVPQCALLQGQKKHRPVCVNPRPPEDGLDLCHAHSLANAI